MPTGVSLNVTLSSVSPASCSRIAASRWPSNVLSTSVNDQAGDGFSVTMP